MGHAVAGNAAFAFGGHQPMRAEAHQVLAHGCLRAFQFGSEFRDLERARFQGLDDAESVRVCEGAKGACAVAEDFRVERGRL